MVVGNCLIIIIKFHLKTYGLPLSTSKKWKR